MSFFTEKQVSKIAKDLRINDPAKIMILHKTIDAAAKNYILAKDNKGRKLDYGDEKETFKKIAKHLKKTAKLYEDIEKSPGSISRFYEGLSMSEDLYPDEHLVLIDNIHKNGKSGLQFFSRTLRILQNSSEIAAEDRNVVFSKENKTDLVLRWLYSIIPFWVMHSEVHISEGRHDDTLERYDSPAMRIFIQMAPKRLKIHPSSIAQAIIKYRKTQENKPKPRRKGKKSFQEK